MTDSGVRLAGLLPDMSMIGERIERISTKLNVNNRAAAEMRAQHHGLVRDLATQEAV